jgi:hypothetical protein
VGQERVGAITSLLITSLLITTNPNETTTRGGPMSRSAETPTDRRQETRAGDDGSTNLGSAGSTMVLGVLGAIGGILLRALALVLSAIPVIDTSSQFQDLTDAAEQPEQEGTDVAEGDVTDRGDRRPSTARSPQRVGRTGSARAAHPRLEL